MANIDKVSVKNTVYNVVSPAVVSDYIEVIGGACTKPDGYEEDEVILAKQNDVQLLFKATQDIAFGANIVENTNCVRTTLEEVLKNAGGGGASSADQVSYDNSESELEAENVQEAVDEVQGNVVSVNSALSNEIATRAKVSGHNLLPNLLRDRTNAGITYTRNADGSVTLDGTSTGYSYTRLFDTALGDSSVTLKKGAYILSGKSGDYATNNVSLAVRIGDTTYTAYGNDEVTITLNAESVMTYASYQLGEGKTLNNLVCYPMLRLATDANSDYEPYAMTNQEITEELSGTYEDITYENNSATRHLYLARVGKVVSVYIPETDLVIDSTVMHIKSGFPLPYGTDAKISCPDGVGGFMRLQINSAGSLYILQGESSATRRIFGIITYICK